MIAAESYVFITTAEVHVFLSSWRERAGVLRSEGDERGATLIERRANEVEAWLRGKADAALTPRSASEATGYSEDHIRRQLSHGELRNVGGKGKPLVRRGDLRPKRPSTLVETNTDAYDVDADVRSLQIRRGEQSV